MKPSIPSGTRDFSPEQVAKRTYIFDTIRQVFIRYGFQPIETPAMEKLSTLTGKYGEEGDQLLFKVLNNGDFLKDAKDLDNYKKLAFQIADRGLRYDLTIPFARYVVMNHTEIALPFKRYQIQPVWRGDNPQHGRYREFYQCDADVVGSNSLLNEAELVQIYDEVFQKLGFKVVIKVNNRKVLQGLAEVLGCPDKMMDITIAIDKLDKIGAEGVKKELEQRGISGELFPTIQQFFAMNLQELATFFANSETGQKGVTELQQLFNYLKDSNLHNELSIDLTLARGLNYYTGCIFEVKVSDENPVKMGSIGGGGRYDDLTGVFGLKGISGVGISFGADRIYDVLEELKLYPDFKGNKTQVLFISFDEASQLYALKTAQTLRQAGINAEVYPDLAKVKKQFEYANKRNIPFTVVVGSDEMATGLLAFKDMTTGQQDKLMVSDIIQKLK
jgi:histidyl-tRNA synthetase